MPATPENIETARKLFEEGGWSSGDAYGPDEWFSDDAVMRDIVNHDGTLRGKEEIRDFWVRGRVGLTLRVPVEEMYVAENHQGVAILWMAYSQIMEEDDEKPDIETYSQQLEAGQLDPNDPQELEVPEGQYYGEVAKNLPNGKGTLIHKDGSEYIGDFVDGKK